MDNRFIRAANCRPYDVLQPNTNLRSIQQYFSVPTRLVYALYVCDRKNYYIPLIVSWYNVEIGVYSSWHRVEGYGIMSMR